MPPKAKFTREDIILAALQIVREQGPKAVTSRNLGKKLGSSACPVFTVFKNMEEVNDEVRKSAKDLYKGYVREGLKQEPAFKGAGLAYIRFAITEPKLFQLLYMQEQAEPTDIENTLQLIDENYEDILRSVQEPYGLPIEEAKKLYQHLWIYTHGIAALCATKVCSFSDAEIQTMITEVFLSIYTKMKGSKLNDSD
jgi:AcrR family transcriptional regulator